MPNPKPDLRHKKEAEIARLDRQIKDITERGTELSNRKKDRLERSEKAKAGLAKATEERQIAEKTLEDLSQKTIWTDSCNRH